MGDRVCVSPVFFKIYIDTSVPEYGNGGEWTFATALLANTRHISCDKIEEKPKPICSRDTSLVETVFKNDRFSLTSFPEDGSLLSVMTPITLWLHALLSLPPHNKHKEDELLVHPSETQPGSAQTRHIATSGASRGQ